MKAALLCVVLCLLWSLVEVHSQTEYPYVSFMGETLPNHTYVDLSLVGSDVNSSVQCHTNLNTCCTGVQGDHLGDWRPPDSEMRLPFSGHGDIYEDREPQRVDLRRRNNAVMPSGIYHCFIATNAIHDDMDNSVRESVYVGLYASGGNVYVMPGQRPSIMVVTVFVMKVAIIGQAGVSPPSRSTG